jgi:hypothetical protein
MLSRVERGGTTVMIAIKDRPSVRALRMTTLLDAFTDQISLTAKARLTFEV